jgi:DNA-directed RNA polymerase specialized sigma subunit
LNNVDYTSKDPSNKLSIAEKKLSKELINLIYNFFKAVASEKFKISEKKIAQQFGVSQQSISQLQRKYFKNKQLKKQSESQAMLD